MKKRNGTDDRPGNLLHIPFLDGIRGLSAFYVVLYHFLAWKVFGLPKPLSLLLLPINFGHGAVSIFIILSGFSLMLSVAASPDQKLKGGLRQYMARRSRRILPPYYAALLLSIAALLVLRRLQLPGSPVEVVTVSGVVSHILLLQDINSIWMFQLNFALWSVATEWQIYFLFPLILLPLWRSYGNIVVIVSGFLLSLTPSIVASLLCRKVVFYGSGCPWYIGLFAMGMAGSAIFCRTRTKVQDQRDILVSRKRLWSGAAVCLGLVALGMLLAGRGTVFAAYVTPVQYLLQSMKDGGTGGLVLCLILLIAFNYLPEKNTFLHYLQCILDSAFARFFARFSYSLYLTHAIVFTILLAIMPAAVSPVEGWLIRALVGVPVSIAFGYIFYLLFEKPTMTKRAAKVYLLENSG